MRHLQTIAVAILLSAPTVALAQERAEIAVPISVRLAEAQAFANRQIPATLIDENRGQTCVEAKKACTKIPEFRGFKIYSRMECVQVTPTIDCTIAQRVWRDGPLHVDGSGRSLTLVQQFGGAATVRGRGEIGRHIRETADGVARLTLVVQPQIKPDWSLAAPFTHRIDWPRRPSAVLFNVFPVTFGTAATEKLNEAIEQFKANDLPQVLRGLDLRERIAAVWADLQRPQQIDLGAGPALFLHFRPDRVGMTPLNVADGWIATTLSIAGRAEITDGRSSPFAGDPTALPNLSDGPAAAGFEVNVPITVGMATLTAMLATELPRSLEFDEVISGALTVHGGRMSQRDSRLVLALDVAADVAGFDAYAGPMTISGAPQWNATTRKLVLENPRLELHDGGFAAALLERVFNSSVMRSWLAAATTFDLTPHILSAEAKLNAALDRELSPGIQMRGSAKLSAPRIDLADGIRILARATGTAEIEGVSID